MKKTIYSEKELFERISQGDQAAFEIIFNHYYPILAKVLARYSDDPEQVKDWIQEVYLRLWENRRSISMATIENARAYFMVSARNHVVKSLGKKKQIRFLASEYETAPEVADNNLEEKLNYQELWQAYKIAMTKLPPRTREAFILNREKGLSYGKVAEQLGTSLKTVETQMTRALSILRHELVSFMH